MSGREELVDEEGPGHKDKEQGVAELGLGIHLHMCSVFSLY